MAGKSSKNNSKAPLFVAVICMAALGGLAAYVMNSPAKSVPASDLAQKQETRKDSVKVYTPTYDKGDLKLTHKTIPVAKNEDPHVAAVNKYLEQLKMVPKDARATSCRIDSGVATVDFSGPFETTYGTEDEQTVLKGVLTALGQFSDIKQVRFTVLGRTLDSLGNVDLTTPQDVLRDPSSGN